MREQCEALCDDVLKVLSKLRPLPNTVLFDEIPYNLAAADERHLQIGGVKLSEPQGEAIRLLVAGFTLEQIARFTNRSPRAVRSILYRVVTKVRAQKSA